MSQPDPQAELEDLKNEVMGEFRYGYYHKHGRFPTFEENVEFWEEYLEGDLKAMEE